MSPLILNCSQRKFFDFVSYGPNNRKKGTMSYPQYCHIPLIINPKHFIFGIIDVIIDTELLPKKIFDFVDYGPNNPEKGTTSYPKYGLSL